MSCNRFRPHLLVLPQDAACRAVAIGFGLVLPESKSRCYQVLPFLSGFESVKRAAAGDVNQLRMYPEGRLLLVVDFDRDENRRGEVEAAVPADLRDRVFILGPFGEVEDLRGTETFQGERSLQSIGRLIGDACRRSDNGIWNDAKLRHNRIDVERLIPFVRAHLLTTNG